jgi:catechol 2,3-dioxygenase-like lactoylglutathione lyase family enzyme
MAKLDHLTIRVRDLELARRWYVEQLGLRVEFEVPERRTVALQDDAELTLFLVETTGHVEADGVALTFQVEDVEHTHRELAAKDVPFVSPPARRFWGYGAELLDPDGHLIYLWDPASMREKGGSV